MAAGNAPCPNCGGMMDLLRTSRQRVQSREILLEWVICTSCRHVRLDRWALLDPQEPVERVPRPRETLTRLMRNRLD